MLSSCAWSPAARTCPGVISFDALKSSICRFVDVAAQGMALVDPLGEAGASFGFGLSRFLMIHPYPGKALLHWRILNQLSGKQTLLRVYQRSSRRDGARHCNRVIIRSR